MADRNTVSLSKETIKKINARFEHRLFKSQTELFYEGQVPHVSYIVLKGEITLIKRKKEVDKLTSGSLIGLAEMYNDKTSRVTANISANSEVIIIEKSEISDILENDQDELFNIVTDILSRAKVPSRAS